MSVLVRNNDYREWFRFGIGGSAIRKQVVSQSEAKGKQHVEYSLRDVNKPIGVSEYQITEKLPEQLKSSLPTIEQIEAELGGIFDE